MNATTLHGSFACAAVGVLFDYRFAESAPVLATEVGELLDERYAAAREHLRSFAREASPLSTKALNETFARTFDLSPSCAPYLSVHLFGEESFKRAELMVGLATAYDAAGFDAGGELPDHLAVVLRFAPLFPEGDWADLARMCLPAPLLRMQSTLEPTTNPYRHAIAALQAILRADFPTETLPCSTSSSSPRSLTSACSSCSLAPSGDTAPAGSATPRCPHSSSKAASSSGAPSAGMSASC